MQDTTKVGKISTFFAFLFPLVFEPASNTRVTVGESIKLVD